MTSIYSELDISATPDWSNDLLGPTQMLNLSLHDKITLYIVQIL
jgi:hypothetical protein